MSDDSSANDALGALRAAIKQAVMDVREQTPLAQSFTRTWPQCPRKYASGFWARTRDQA